ncbi:23S rRNA (uracil(1939)-C(5))-methyltransferase RlmD [Nitrincola sp. MINF-07-Sa-05]|uniref:23S rRNA (uracil(1939)-C(5))-methyltransferase RlmD n=1 Tax=Nitrincola salilacus TaxID=3400273 RepID=UPI0039181CA5
MHKRRTARHSRQSLPQTPIELDVTGLSIEGRGVARHEGKTVFVRGALAGEKVTAKLENRHSRYDEASLIECISTCPDRVEPACRHYQECGGCDLQHFNLDKQLDFKESAVLDQLSRFSKVTPTQIDAPIQSATAGYRRSARIGINQLQRDGSLIIGFRRRNSNKLTRVEHCMVLDSRADTLFSALYRELEPFTDLKLLTHLDITLGDESGALTFRATRTPSEELIEALKRVAESLSLQLYLELNDHQLTPVGVHPPLTYTLPDADVTLQFAPDDFLQINAEVNRKMVSRALEWLTPTSTDSILDLYCGLGNFTLALAKHAGKVTGIEGSMKMVERAQSNATLNNCDNVSFHCADLSQDCSASAWMRQKYDLILLDPPRSGAAEQTKSLSKTGAKRILYIACNPSVLVRDSATLASQGYKMTRFCVLDMFPQTSHVESMALFEKK